MARTRTLDAPPRGTPLWVTVTVLNAGLLGLVGCGSHRPQSPPPTCGPCCHNPEGAECQQLERRASPEPTPDAAITSDAGADAPP